MRARHTTDLVQVNRRQFTFNVTSAPLNYGRRDEANKWLAGKQKHTLADNANKNSPEVIIRFPQV